MAYEPSDNLQKLIDRRIAGEAGDLPEDEESRELLPTLWAFLTRRSVNDELAKDPAAITIRLGLGQWLVELTDPTLEVGLTAVVPKLHEALEALEMCARDPKAPFRPWRGSSGKFKKRNKRLLSNSELNT
jgi:hypothetical protein